MEVYSQDNSFKINLPLFLKGFYSKWKYTLNVIVFPFRADPFLERD